MTHKRNMMEAVMLYSALLILAVVAYDVWAAPDYNAVARSAETAMVALP